MKHKSKATQVKAPMAAASEWLALLMSPEATPDDVRAAEAWVKASPAHREAWELAKAVWDSLGEMAATRPQTPSSPSSAPPPKRRP